MEDIGERRTIMDRSGTVLDRAEALYLKALRAILLVVATVLLFCALIWAGISLTRVLRSPDSVIEKPSVVAAAELAGVSKQASTAANKGSAESRFRSERSYYDDVVQRYFRLYQARYQPSQRTGDKRLTIGEFDDLTINASGRLDALKRGELDFATDKADLETFFPIVSEVSSSQATTDRLAQYRLAKKKSVVTQVRRTRTETRRGWDTYSEACDNWYQSPIGCAVTRRVEVPYSEKISVLRYPDGINSPMEILKGYQDRYFALLAERRATNSAEASSKRQDILAGQAIGREGLSRSVLIVGAFLILMFFFLLVAIERHQRRLASTLA